MSRDSKRSKDIFLMITNDCNLSCKYCYEGIKDKRVISATKAKNILEKELDKNKKDFDEIFVVFHGGEPFLAFPEMKEISEWLWKTYPNRNIKCLVTTNGTVLTEKMKSWLTTNKNKFVPILSIDGKQEYHDQNRPNSYKYIDKAFFLSNWPWQEVKMTIAPNTLPHIFDNFLELKEYGFIVNPSLAKEVEWNLEEALPLFALEMKKLAHYFLENPNEKPCKLIDVGISDLSPLKNLPFNRACGAGGDIITYDVEGNPYPCHAFIGNPNMPYNKDAIDKTFSLLKQNNGALLSKGCIGCHLYPICSPCYGLNYANRGNMGKFDPKMCEFNKVAVLATANMYAHMLSSEQSYEALKHKTQEDLYLLASGIKHVLKAVQFQ